MARDTRFTAAMRAATTHVGTGGNPKVGVPVGFVRPSPHHAFFPLASPDGCLACLPAPSQAPGTKMCPSPPYEDTSARAVQVPFMRLESEGCIAPLVRETALAPHAYPALCVSSACPAGSVWPVSSVSWAIPLVTLHVSASAHVVSVDKHRQDKIKQQDRSRPAQTRPHNKASRVQSPKSFSSRWSQSRFAHPTSYADLASSSDDEDSLSSSDDDDTASSPVCSPLSMVTNPFSELSAPPAPVSAYRVSYDLAGLPVTVPLPFTPHAMTNPSPAVPTNPYPFSSLGAVSALLPSSPLIADSGCTSSCLTSLPLPHSSRANLYRLSRSLFLTARLFRSVAPPTLQAL